MFGAQKQDLPDIWVRTDLCVYYPSSLTAILGGAG